MVVVEVNSGLGNQMFQYAAGLGLAKRLNVPLRIDTTWYDVSDSQQTPRNFELNHYGIAMDFITSVELDRQFRLKGEGLLQRLKNRINRSKPYYLQRVYNEPHFHYDANFERAQSPVMLSGYWQSERYFMNAADAVRKAFTVPVPESLQHWVKAMQQSVSVSVHVRRGDMVNNPAVMQVHGYCNHDYYQNAIRLMQEAFPECVFFVFSDDLNWCRTHLGGMGTLYFVDGNEGSKAYLDIQLMRHCQHHIIANSSFSWWGAWLNPSPEKQVIAPMRWFAHDRHDTRDLIPVGWQRI